jgi:arsenite methyltransferase
MATQNDEQIRKAVRNTYAGVAPSQEVPPARTGEELSCCAPVRISSKPEPASCCGILETTPDKTAPCCDPAAPGDASSGLGCGNPTAIASLEPGEVVVDLGSGGGFDCFLASEKVGVGGKVIGIDMTPDMVSKARANALKTGAANVEFRLGEIEHLPVADNTADIIISNCVINLAPDKLAVYKEAFRVLKPGGRLTIADTMANKPLPEEIKKDLGLWSCCIGGAITPDETSGLLKQAGFAEITITENTNSRDLVAGWTSDTGKKELDIVSAYIEAVKPV